MTQYPKIAIIYLSYHSEPYLSDVVSALKKLTYPKDKVEFVIVDNPHPQYGNSARFLEETVLPMSGAELPHVTLLPQEKNLGFAGGNNVGIKWALENGFDYVYFHNNDGFLAADALEPLAEIMETDKTVGAVQSLLLLYPETNLHNSTGNSFHYLGLGYCNNLRVPVGKIDLPPVFEIAYASGAALLMRADLLRALGVWDEDFWLYHEDMEYSLRLRSLGYKIMAARASIFYHKYAFGRNQEKFYFIERNRWGVMLMFFQWPTLILFIPPAILLELGLLVFAAKSGWLKEKLAVYGYWLKPSSWKLWLSKRRRIQTNRKVSDREMLRLATGVIKFEERSINNPLLKYVGNPILNFYWKIVRIMIFW